ncbi:MAG: hypothetical protein KO464_02255 [Candidatus Methanofastidiosum sp.]|nr:hypothetical protein [Methanofastidiosum sp.]
MNKKSVNRKPATIVNTYKTNPESKKYLPRVEVFDFAFEVDRSKYAWIHSHPNIVVGSETGTFDKTGCYHLVSFIEIEATKYTEVCKKLSQTEFSPFEFVPKSEATASNNKSSENKTEQDAIEDEVKLNEADILDDITEDNR